MLLDINVAPGTTETSLFPQAATAEAAARGVDADEIYIEILQAALRDAEKTDDKAVAGA